MGGKFEVLVEGRSRRDERRFSGRTAQNNIVAFPAVEDLTGRIVRVRVCDFTALTLIGDRYEEVEE